MAFPPYVDREKAHEKNAYFARLAALNTALEAARVGPAAHVFGHRALSSDALLVTFLQEIQSQKTS